MNWMKCESSEDLKLLGSFNNVKKTINHDLKGLVVITAKSWDDLFIKIRALNAKFTQGNSKCEGVWVDGFISETHKYLFCLLELDGENRMKHLGITKLHYVDSKIAKRWKNNILHKIHSDVCSDTRANSAMLVLDELYSEMAQ